ncbi:MAG: type II secretion system F family protein, partial [Terriglobia bacterium]
MDFVCKIGTAAGQILNHTETADSEADVRERLAGQGYYVFSVRSKDWLKGRLRQTARRRVKTDDFVIFNQQFLTLSKS